MRTSTSLGAVGDAWCALAHATGAPPFLWPGWTAAWLAAFGEQQPTIFTVWRDGQPVALMPVLRGTAGVASPTNDQTPLFGPLATDAAAAERLVEAIVRDRPARVCLGDLDPTATATAQVLAALRGCGYRGVPERTLRAPYTDVTGDWDAFATRIGRNRRGGLRRSERRMRELGELRVDVHAGGDDLDDVLVEGLRIEASGWKGRHGTAILSTARMRTFYTAVAHWAARQGWLHLLTMRIGGQAVAFMYFLRRDGVLYYLKGGYDEAYSKYGPGIWLLHHVLREAFADGTRRIEWLGADDPYKLEWSDGTDEHVTSVWYPPTVRGRSTYHCRTLWRTSRRNSKDALRAVLPQPVIDRVKASGHRVAQLGPGR